MKRNLAALSCLLLLLLMMLAQYGRWLAQPGNLSVGISADIQIMDPHISWVVVDRYLIENVYEGLVELDESMQPVPAQPVLRSQRGRNIIQMRKCEIS